MRGEMAMRSLPKLSGRLKNVIKTGVFVIFRLLMDNRGLIIQDWKVKVLVLHDPYRPIESGSVGGEDNLANLEIKVLSNLGHEVIDGAWIAAVDAHLLAGAAGGSEDQLGNGVAIEVSGGDFDTVSHSLGEGVEAGDD